MGSKWLPHGRQIQARDIETIVGVHFKDLREFINLCNSVAWAQQGSEATSVPSFTERYEVADGGVDAEWIAFQVTATPHVPRHLLVTGWNVYQYKQRDILANGRDECFKSLKSGVSGALHSSFARTGKRPQGFVLFTNIDLSHETQAHTSDGKNTQAWKKELRESILKDYDEPDSVGVEIVGAAELAAMLNDLPHLRSAYFCRSDFITRDEAWTGHNLMAFPPGTVQLTGRDHDLKSLQWALENPEVRVIVISGQVSVGKTRLVLEATANRSMDTIVARNPRSVRPGDLSDLLSQHHLTIVFVPGYEPEKSESIIDYAIAQKGLKLVVEVASPENLVPPWFGRDERVVPFQVRTLSSADSTALLKAAGAKFESGVEEWVLDKTSGNPGLLLMATHESFELRSDASSFSNSVVKSMTKTIRRDLGKDSLETLRFLSLFDPIPLHEIDTRPMQVFAGTLGLPEAIHGRVQDDVVDFTERGLIRGGERYAVVEPCLLANGLVTQIIGRAGNDFWDAFVRLSPYIQLSLLSRLRQVGAEETGRFWDRLFGPEGPFADFKLSVGHLELLLAVATQVPVSVAEKVLTELKSLNPESRRNCIQGIRLQLIWLLEYFLILPDVAETALRCILLLAEVDDTPENHRPNPKADFRELFHPLHRQVALSLEKRHTLLAEYVKRSNPDWLRQLALQALQTALRHRIAYGVRNIPGPMPALRSDAIAITEAFSYQDILYDLLLEIARSQDPTVSPCASESGLIAFSEYFAGWSRIDHVSAAERLDHLNEENVCITRPECSRPYSWDRRRVALNV